jgi:hypothetical protein
MQRDGGAELPADLPFASAGSVVRVSIKRSVRDPDLLVVRTLDSGKALPPGRTEAFLVFPGPDANPFGGAAPKGRP